MSESGSGMPDISGIINGLMGNPEFANLIKEMRGGREKNSSDIEAEVVGKLPEIMSILGPMMSGNQTQSKDERETKTPPKKDDLDENSMKFLKKIEKFDRAKATRLMSALKPYLSPSRCGMIDKCMSVIQIGDVMTVLRGIDGIGKSES